MVKILIFLLFFNNTFGQNKCIENLSLKSKSGYVQYENQKYGMFFDTKVTFDTSKIFIKFIGNPNKESITLYIKQVESCNKLTPLNTIAIFNCYSEEKDIDTTIKFLSRAILIRNKEKYQFEFMLSDGMDTKMHFEMIVVKKKIPKIINK